MPKITVIKPFNLLLTGSNDRLKFEPGIHDVSAEVADHWYTREHCEDPAKVAGTVQYAENLRKQATAAPAGGTPETEALEAEADASTVDLQPEQEAPAEVRPTDPVAAERPARRGRPPKAK